MTIVTLDFHSRESLPRLINTLLSKYDISLLGIKLLSYLPNTSSSKYSKLVERVNCGKPILERELAKGEAMNGGEEDIKNWTVYNDRERIFGEALELTATK